MPRPECPVTRTCFALAALLLTNSLVGAAPPSLLAVKPTEALNTLAQLDGRKPAVTDDEHGLFEDARDGKFDQYSFAEACLIAGFVTDQRDRKKYLDRLDEIEAAARKATRGSKSVAEDGSRLLEFLHAGPMAKGYKAMQTDLHVLLDTGEYNCVSSAALYTVMGQRLGIDARAVDLPRHVFSVLVTRDRPIDVETTSPQGFDADPRRDLGPAKAFRPLAERREVRPPGLAGVVAFNHGVMLAHQKKFAAAIRSYLLALCLDGENRDAARAVVDDMVFWAMELSRDGKHEKAMAVVTVAREFAPKEAKFHRATLVVCDAWAREYVEKRDWTGAAQVYSRGLREYPGDKLLENNLAYCNARIR
jgi:tetratricopeptide (TPR) repeat protein